MIPRNLPLDRKLQRDELCVREELKVRPKAETPANKLMESGAAWGGLDSNPGPSAHGGRAERPPSGLEGMERATVWNAGRGRVGTGGVRLSQED